MSENKQVEIDHVREKLFDAITDIIDYIPFDIIDEVVDHLISNGVTVQKWIPVSERLPDNSEHDWVLAQVVEDNGYMHIPKVMEYRQNRNDWHEETYGWLSQHNGAFKVTHWMPLPELPKECE